MIESKEGERQKMDKKNTSLASPYSDDMPIWRYIDFTKFLDLISRKELWFARVDRLPDPFEGSFPKGNIAWRKSHYAGLMSPDEIGTLSEFYKLFLKFTYVNCWHASSYQSDASWRLYPKSNDGIAIKSTFGRLKSSLAHSPHLIHFRKVRYIRFTKEVIDDDTRSPYFHKRKAFEHEKELRALIQVLRRDTNGDFNFGKPPFTKGLYVKVDLDQLIERVVTAPLCEDWLPAVTKSVLQKYGLKNMEVRKSTLYERDARITY